MTWISGTIKQVHTGACESTTGRAEADLHLFVQTTAHGRINLHLGPLGALRDVPADRCGRPRDGRGFPHRPSTGYCYIARTLTIDGGRVMLRDRSLRPRWRRPAQ